MVSTGLLVIVAVLIFTGFYRWTRRHGLDAPGPATTDGQHRIRISLLTEAIGYVGAILLLAGGIAALSQRWDSISDWGHVGVFAAAAIFFLLAGIVAYRGSEPAVQRLAGVVWVLSVACAGAATGFASQEVFRNSAEVTVAAVGIAATVYSAVLWRARQRALQDAALSAGLIIAICGTVLTAMGGPGPAPSLAIALALWAFGLAWAWLGWQRYVEPAWVTITIGVLLALFTPSIAVGEHGWVYAIGIATAGAAMAGSVPLRNIPLLALGTVSMFGYVTAVVIRYLHDSLGVPGALAFTGLLILGLAVISTRLTRAARPRRPRQPDADGAGREDLPRAA